MRSNTSSEENNKHLSVTEVFCGPFSGVRQSGNHQKAREQSTAGVYQNHGRRLRTWLVWLGALVMHHLISLVKCS